MKTIRELRGDQGWTQLELAYRIGVTPLTVSVWERGINTPRVSHLRKLAETFGVPMDAILVADEPALHEEGHEYEARGALDMIDCFNGGDDTSRS